MPRELINGITHGANGSMDVKNKRGFKDSASQPTKPIKQGSPDNTLAKAVIRDRRARSKKTNSNSSALPKVDEVLTKPVPPSDAKKSPPKKKNRQRSKKKSTHESPLSSPEKVMSVPGPASNHKKTHTSSSKDKKQLPSSMSHLSNTYSGHSLSNAPPDTSSLPKPSFL